MELDLIPTLAFMAVLGAVSVFAGFMGARPPSHKGPRLMPWRMIMLFSATAVIVLLVHLLTLLGLKQDRPYI
jgi:hypothetical protein